MTAAPTSCRFYRVNPVSGEVIATSVSLLAVYDHTQRKKEASVTSNRVEFELTPGCRQVGDCPQTGFAEIGRANSTPVARHFSQEDFWPGITFLIVRSPFTIGFRGYFHRRLATVSISRKIDWRPEMSTP
jgi:hypothetical protein